MASGKEYLDFVLEQLRGIDGVFWRPMMGEYILYYNGRVVGGIFDDRLLVKPTESARRYLENVVEEIPYPGAKPMLLVEEFEREGYLAGLFRLMEPELPPPKQRK